MKTQHISNQRGEINFRKKLYEQQVERKAVFQDENDASGIEKILEARMRATREQMTGLKAVGILQAPFLEIGAERGQRSLVVENDFGLRGAAADISFEMLKSCEYYRKVYKQDRMPLRVCCDANNLPFASNAFPFVFCYETLHHFPEPLPITSEIYRVLSPGGSFLFEEEPFRRRLHLHLYQRKKSYAYDGSRRSMLAKALDFLFCDEGSNEVDHGVIENMKVTLGAWKRALRPFDEKDVELTTVRNIKSSLYRPASLPRHMFTYLAGGKISGVCKKRGTLPVNPGPVSGLLICPSCRETGDEVRLQTRETGLACPGCGKTYPVVEGVLFLFSYTKFRELYPEILDRCLATGS